MIIPRKTTTTRKIGTMTESVKFSTFIILIFGTPSVILNAFIIAMGIGTVANVLAFFMGALPVGWVIYRYVIERRRYRDYVASEQ